MARLLALALVLAAAAPAYAGLDCDDAAAVKDLEAFAKDKTKAKAMEQNYSWLCVELDAVPLKPRIEKACKKILDRDGDKHTECVVEAAAAGIGKLGDHDIFALVGLLPEDPIDSAGGIGLSKADFYARIADPRAVQILVDTWKAAIPRADKREKRHGSMGDWSAWRQNAAQALGALGDADTKVFLEEQAKATKDTHVRDACNDAAAAIGKRIK